MKDHQHNTKTRCRRSDVHHSLMRLFIKGTHKPSLINVMFLSMHTGLRIQEIINLRHRHLTLGEERETAREESTDNK